MMGKAPSGPRVTDIYVDGDACPVREEIYRVATRLRVNVFVVSNGSRPIRPPGMSNVSIGLPLVHFNDSCCGSIAELRSIILKARRLADDHAEQERAANVARMWLLAQIQKKRSAPSADIADTAPDASFVPERLAA